MRTAWQQRLQNRPFRVRQIAWQTQAASGKLPPGGVSPHVILRRCVATPTESQITDITQLIFRSGSYRNLSLSLLFIDVNRSNPAPVPTLLCQCRRNTLPASVRAEVSAAQEVRRRMHVEVVQEPTQFCLSLPSNPALARSHRSAFASAQTRSASSSTSANCAARSCPMPSTTESRFRRSVFLAPKTSAM